MKCEICGKEVKKGYSVKVFVEIFSSFDRKLSKKMSANLRKKFCKKCGDAIAREVIQHSREIQGG
ncbi:MAG: hypothetical protein QXP04_02815 [Candidatus Nanoarchaeia archaeon]|nr:hypothetical protein [Candidatus Jingweiarchaeum tengchongense]